MSFPTKVQLIQRKASEQWYINFPSALAQAMDFSKGETVEWSVHDKAHLILSLDCTPKARHGNEGETYRERSRLCMCPHANTAGNSRFN